MKTRKPLSILLTLCLIVGLIPWTVLPARAADVITMTEDTDEWTDGNTYKVTSNVNFGGARIKVSGTVSLVLGEGTTLTVPLGIYVPAGAALNISGTGALVIEGGSDYGYYYRNKAGIGSNDEGEACGTVIINGGTITVTGGESAAGIGGSYCGAGGTVTISGGTVNATGGKWGAGIGGGQAGKGGTVTITGGTVTANGGEEAAGIGGGLFSEDNGSLTLGGSQLVYGGGDPNPTTILNNYSTDRPRYMIVKTFSSAEMHDLANATVNGVKSFYKHTGAAIDIACTVTMPNGTSLTKGTDYTETVTMNGESVQTVQAKGEYTLTITGKSPYTGSQTFHFIVSDAIPVTAETTAFEGETPYCASGSVTVSSRIAVSGTATLILAEGAKLTVPKGINVPKGATLNISGTGELVIDGVRDYAGIGCDTVGSAAGTINISGGTINVTGGTNGAGIGGGTYGGGGTVTITGGTVYAIGGNHGAGIGGGSNGDGGTVTISGGTVYATGGALGAGIGGGSYGTGGTVTITGGTVYATGGEQAAGIGGGYCGDGGTVTINGGTVNATGGKWGAGIGGGDGGAGGSLTVSDGMYVMGSADGTSYSLTEKQDGDYARAAYMKVVPLAAQVGDTYYSTFADAVAAWTNGTLTLLADVTIGAPLTIPADKTVVLDLNGHAVDRGLAGKEAQENGYVIKIVGDLTLTDSVGGGKLTGGNTTGSGGGVFVDNGGTFTMTGGTITGNSARFGGGGVALDGGEFTMEHGTIAGNTASRNGGGVFVGGSSGKFTMNDGTISGNAASNNGGGVCIGGLYPEIEFTMTGGSVTGNNAGYGGGVFVASVHEYVAAFNVSGGATVKDNFRGGTKENGVYIKGDSGAANNVYLEKEDYTAKITVTGELTGGENAFGVTLASGYTGAFTSGLDGKGSAANFTSDNGAYFVGLTAGKEAALGVPSFSDDGKVTAPKGATLVCAKYESGKMTGVWTAPITDGCVGESAKTLLNLETLPAGCKLFLLAKGTFAPLCEAWSN